MLNLALLWHVAMLTSDIDNVDEEALLDEDEWPPYQPATTIAAPTDPPEKSTPGVYYGANGYQTGINVRGTNRYMTDGTTGEPEENTSLRVVLGNSDHSTYVVGYNYFGYIAGGYAGSVVRLPEPPYDETEVTVTHYGNDVDVTSAVMRWNDPTFDDVSVDAFYSSSDTDYISLPSLPEDGTPVYGVGEIGDIWPITTFDLEGGSTDQNFYDSDRWLLDLSDRALGSSVQVHIWLDRQYENENGDVAPYDPWFAVVPEDWVPTPTYADTNRDACAHADAVGFEYPVSLLDFLYGQLVINEFPIDMDSTSASCGDSEADADTDTDSDTDTDTDTDSDTDFDARGALSAETTSCLNDWDGDGVLDEDEPSPASFYQQVLVQMCGIDPSLVDGYEFTPSNFDVDSRDEDEAPSYDRLNNTGGSADSSGEEAWLDITLQGGETYVIVVSGGSDNGVYEFTVQEIPG